MPTLYQVIYVALIVAFTVLFLGKTGLRTKIRDKADEFGIGLVADMLECDFCLCFWLSFIASFIIAFLTCDISMFLIPFLSTPIARFMI